VRVGACDPVNYTNQLFDCHQDVRDSVHLPFILSVRPSTFHIFNFFSRMAAGIYSKLGTNIPYEIPAKFVIFKWI